VAWRSMDGVTTTSCAGHEELSLFVGLRGR
jgi:hypothetical protein